MVHRYAVIINLELKGLATHTHAHTHTHTHTQCDQICQKGSYTRPASGLTFHYHSTDTTIDQQFMLVPLPNLQQSAFTEASFTGLSGFHRCLGGLLIALTCPAMQTDGREFESPQEFIFIY